MEDEKKRVQKFYFTEDGKLIVESNKGVWADGEQFVKMYGRFECNAKTMGVIIQHFKGIPVEVGVEEIVRHARDNVVDEILNVFEHTIEHYCIIGADPVRIKEYEEEMAEKHYSNTEITKAKEQTDQWKKLSDQWKNLSAEHTCRFDELAAKVKQFNDLPWYKRIFKKITV